MRDSKKRLIHNLFSLASTLETKVLMNESDYNNFYNACYIPSLNKSAGDYKELVSHDYKEACENGYLRLCYAPIHGGFKVVRLQSGGGENDDLIMQGRNDATTLANLIYLFNKGFHFKK